MCAHTIRMKNSIKSRMEVLLEQEIEERAQAKASTATSQTGQTSQMSESSRENEETKADMLFNTDNGE